MPSPMHYEAFLSYRHTPRDTLVASHIQKALERYHIPRPIQKELQIKQIKQVFRDQEELQITSDLRHSIARALENSDYLIVICSPDTAASEWVMWEIKTFLKTHSLDKVMTVVASGDPVDVIPPILKKRTETITGCQGESIQVERTVEPLACNYTGNLKKADQIELPRLVATILGCPYASLVQRQRQYQMQRKMAFSVVLAILLILISGYMAFSRNQIHESYLNALESQAKNKATESTEMLSQYDYVAATQLALEALPSEENPEIPITSQAQSALTDAVSAYHVNELAQSWTYSAKDEVTDYQFSQSGAYLMAMDASNILTVWDCETHQEVYSTKIMVESILSGFLPLDDNLVIVWNGSYVTCVDYLQHAEVWERPLESTDVSCVLSPDQSTLFVASSNTLALLDSHKGELLYSADLTEESLVARSYSPAIFLDDDTVLFACDTLSQEEQKEETPYHLETLRLVRWDAQTGEISIFSHRFKNIKRLLLSQDGTYVCVLTQTGEPPQELESEGESFYAAPMEVTSLRIPSGLVAWVRQLEGTNYRYDPIIKEVSYKDPEGELRAGVLCAYSTLSCLFDLELGGVVSSVTLSGSVLSCLRTQSESCLYLTHNGRLLVHDYAQEASYTQRTLHTQIEMARSVPRESLVLLPSMALKSGSNLLYYTYLSDESAKAEATLGDASFYRIVRGDHFFLLQGKERKNLYFFYTGEKSTLTQVTIQDPLSQEEGQKEEAASASEGKGAEEQAEVEAAGQETEQAQAQELEEEPTAEDTSEVASDNDELSLEDLVWLSEQEAIPIPPHLLSNEPEYTLVGASSDASCAFVLRYHLSTSSLALLRVRAETGETTLEVDLSQVGADYSSGSSSLPYLSFQEGILSFCSAPEKENLLYQYDTDNGLLSYTRLQSLGTNKSLSYLYFDKETQGSMLVPSPLLPSPNGSLVFLSIYDTSQDINQGALVNLSDGSVTYLDLGEEDEEEKAESTSLEEGQVAVAGATDSLSDISFSAAWSSSSRYIAALFDQDIKIFDRTGLLLGTITPSSLQGAAFHFYRDDLLLLTGSTLSRYSITGELLNSVRLVKGNATSTTLVVDSPTYLWDAYYPHLFVSVSNLMYILNTKDYFETSLGSVGGYLFYDSVQDRFYTFDTTTCRITSFSHHDLEELTEMAEHRLAGT